MPMAVSRAVPRPARSARRMPSGGRLLAVAAARAAAFSSRRGAGCRSGDHVAEHPCRLLDTVAAQRQHQRQHRRRGQMVVGWQQPAQRRRIGLRPAQRQQLRRDLAIHAAERPERHVRRTEDVCRRHAFGQQHHDGHVEGLRLDEVALQLFARGAAIGLAQLNDGDRTAASALVVGPCDLPASRQEEWQEPARVFQEIIRQAGDYDDGLALQLFPQPGSASTVAARQRIIICWRGDAYDTAPSPRSGGRSSEASPCSCRRMAHSAIACLKTSHPASDYSCFTVRHFPPGARLLPRTYVDRRNRNSNASQAFAQRWHRIFSRRGR